MKKLNLLAVCLLMAGLTACDDDTKQKVNGNATAVANNLKSGTWTVTKFIEATVDETDHFLNYDFTFGQDGVLTATDGTNTYTGTWAVYDDESTDDDLYDSDMDVVINFTEPVDFLDLNDDWDVYTRTGIEIQLVDVTGGDSEENAEVDFLTFQKKEALAEE